MITAVQTFTIAATIVAILVLGPILIWTVQGLIRVVRGGGKRRPR